MTSKMISSVLPTASSRLPALIPASKAAGVRFGSSWARNQMHGAKMFDAKLERLTKVAAKRGVTLRKPTIAKPTNPSQDMVVAAGTFLTLTGTTAYLATSEHTAHSQEQPPKTDAVRSFGNSNSGSRLAM
mmetsp:Transcript_125731/g.187694  ORF Transcript_125731/g.187694 Transcript_125731/m.187694 type:complete len:130 (-) Transcript_125731:75-464(-)|eukprot:CAMPEP_0177726510 /NCGR_PEP_ID=MMETSP0484_2-20121128/19813_1 /TAXON_ID=354590 /ORGANISM="Rhodomonas lens, Strain RHODO" /LENGTH=129 /DNA_ID=CAMNT_0019239075 /DNA_START=65 /DNA_END=454 /DNA_ORIENTATION=+